MQLPLVMQLSRGCVCQANCDSGNLAISCCCTWLANLAIIITVPAVAEFWLQFVLLSCVGLINIIGLLHPLRSGKSKTNVGSSISCNCCMTHATFHLACAQCTSPARPRLEIRMQIRSYSIMLIAIDCVTSRRCVGNL